MANTLNTNAKVPSGDNEMNENFEDIDQNEDDELGGDEGKWLSRAREAYASSTSYVDANYRPNWDKSIDLFNNQHPVDSKYRSPAFEKRSKIFRPKSRAVVRKYEAATAAAFFSNQDLLNTEACASNNPQATAGAALTKALVQHRLKTSIPWFKIVQGGVQDGQVIGACCAHIYWEHITKDVEVENTPTMEQQLGQGFQGENLTPPSLSDAFTFDDEIKSEDPIEIVKQYRTEVVSDKPVVDLIPLDNIRVDPACSWLDPVNTSPYFIELIPMYVVDVKRRMKQGVWRQLSTDTIMQAMENKSNSTTMARNKNKQNPYDSGSKIIHDYATVWVQRHIHRDENDDYEFYMLGEKALLTTPVKLSESVLHGRRPYVIGTVVLETHKPFPSSIVELGAGLQEEANEIANQRLDNVKFALNKRYIIKRNKQVDIQALVRNVPGGVITADDINGDIRELSIPDVTQSSYVEQEHLNGDMDELLGNFNAGFVSQRQGAAAETAKGITLLSQQANTMVEYFIRTYTETFIEPILRQLILLEQHYETDETILAIAGEKAQLFQKFGISEQLDSLLDHELVLTVNVGMGATSPDQKIAKLSTAINALKNVMGPNIASAINMEEVTKEIFGALGYSDGSRFIKQGSNPQLDEAKSLISKLQTELKSKEAELATKFGVAKMQTDAKLAIAGVKETAHNNRFLVDHFFDKTAQFALQNDQSMKPKAVVEAGKTPPPMAPAPSPQQAPGPGRPVGPKVPQMSDISAVNTTPKVSL